MGTSGPGNITHIDNLYVKTFNVKDNININLGDYVIIEPGTGEARKLLDSDFSAAGEFLDLQTENIVQAGESANNLNSTDASLRKNKIECITKGSDWVVTMLAGVIPDTPIGIFRTGSVENHKIGNTVVAKEILGSYKHKEFSTVATPSLLDDNGIISTGRHI